ncbi:hypothetical protein ACFLTE_12240, partial [Bacteroidota bacterium]
YHFSGLKIFEGFRLVGIVNPPLIVLGKLLALIGATRINKYNIITKQSILSTTFIVQSIKLL